jgi:hypothetical protein
MLIQMVLIAIRYFHYQKKSLVIFLSLVMLLNSKNLVNMVLKLLIIDAVLLQFMVVAIKSG